MQAANGTCMPLCVSPSLRCATSFHVYFIHKRGFAYFEYGSIMIHEQTSSALEMQFSASSWIEC